MKKHREKEWFDDDSFWQDMYPYMFAEERFQEAEDQVDKVLELTEPRGKAVLDLCCGPGRFSIPLAKRGFSVTGVDRTAFLLEKARARAKAAKVEIEWQQEDMRDFVRPDSFHLALSMFTSFGYFDDKSEDKTVLENVFVSLRPTGVFLIDLMGKERLARIFGETTSVEFTDGTRLVQRHEIFDDWTRIRNEWILIRKGHAKSFRFHHTIYSGQELRCLLESVGFGEVKLYGDFEGGEYGLNAQRLIAVGIKPEA